MGKGELFFFGPLVEPVVVMLVRCCCCWCCCYCYFMHLQPDWWVGLVRFGWTLSKTFCGLLTPVVIVVVVVVVFYFFQQDVESFARSYVLQAGVCAREEERLLGLKVTYPSSPTRKKKLYNLVRY